MKFSFCHSILIFLLDIIQIAPSFWSLSTKSSLQSVLWMLCHLGGGVFKHRHSLWSVIHCSSLTFKKTVSVKSTKLCKDYWSHSFTHRGKKTVRDVHKCGKFLFLTCKAWPSSSSSVRGISRRCFFLDMIIEFNQL